MRLWLLAACIVTFSVSAKDVEKLIARPLDDYQRRYVQPEYSPPFSRTCPVPEPVTAPVSCKPYRRMWNPRIVLEGYGGTRPVGFGDLIVPFLGGNRFVAYGDGRGYVFSRGAYELNTGGGFRYVTPNCCWMVGAFAFYDFFRLPNIHHPAGVGEISGGLSPAFMGNMFPVHCRTHSIHFSRATFGLELLSCTWDFRFNWYQPIGRRTKLRGDFSACTAVGNTFFPTTTFLFDTIQPALEWEIGRCIPLIPRLKVFLGSYHFLRSGGLSGTNGVKARIEYRLRDNITIVVRNYWDSVRKNQILAGVRWKIGGKPCRPVCCPLSCRLTDPVIRDLGTLFNGGARQSAVRTATSNIVPLECDVIFVDNTNPNPGDGTFTDPFQSIALAQASPWLPGDHIFIFENGGGPYTAGSPLPLLLNQIFQGQGVALNVAGCPFIPANQGPTLQGGIQVVNGNTVMGFTLTDGFDLATERIGISGVATTNLDINNLTVTSITGVNPLGNAIGIQLLGGATVDLTTVTVSSILGAPGVDGLSGVLPGTSGTVGTDGGNAIGFNITGITDLTAFDITASTISGGSGGNGGSGIAGTNGIAGVPSGVPNTPGGIGGLGLNGGSGANGSNGGDARGFVFTGVFAGTSSITSSTASGITGGTSGAGGSGASGGNGGNGGNGGAGTGAIPPGAVGGAGGIGGNGGNAGGGGNGGDATGFDLTGATGFTTLTALVSTGITGSNGGSGGAAGSAGTGGMGGAGGNGAGAPLAGGAGGAGGLGVTGGSGGSGNDGGSGGNARGMDLTASISLPLSAPVVSNVTGGVGGSGTAGVAGGAGGIGGDGGDGGVGSGLGIFGGLGGAGNLGGLGGDGGHSGGGGQGGAAYGIDITLSTSSSIGAPTITNIGAGAAGMGANAGFGGDAGDGGSGGDGGAGILGGNGGGGGIGGTGGLGGLGGGINPSMSGGNAAGIFTDPLTAATTPTINSPAIQTVDGGSGGSSGAGGDGGDGGAAGSGGAGGAGIIPGPPGASGLAGIGGAGGSSSNGADGGTARGIDLQDTTATGSVTFNNVATIDDIDSGAGGNCGPGGDGGTGLVQGAGGDSGPGGGTAGDGGASNGINTTGYTRTTTAGFVITNVTGAAGGTGSAGGAGVPPGNPSSAGTPSAGVAKVPAAP